MAYEPATQAKDETITWIKARMAHVRSANNTMEIVFARLLSLLAYHADFGTMIDDLGDFATFIPFYLKAIATEKNLSLIPVYHIAQRVKQFRDGPSKDNTIKPRCAGRQGKKRKPDLAAASNRTPASATPARKHKKASPSTATTPTTTPASRDGATATTGKAAKWKPARPPKTPNPRITKNVKYVEDDGTRDSEEKVSLNYDSESGVEMVDGDDVSKKEVFPEAPLNKRNHTQAIRQ
ncbi:hypothetical protein L873DRAFT_1846747 [Choiromyces venosus 120613-1]|uniref:Uncharacterized protein n=1 Tax=Choiromyces venosus 120613-1 TaxID=1336337 RepID=A0A3N4JC04_9PEZI|nr:hypothetical protein L873DRAFT_1846747 [Choiromyces venosus 120613-1]